MRAIKLEKDMVLQYSVSPNQIIYRKQSFMHVGDLLFLLEGDYKLSHSFDVKVHPTPPKASFIIQEIQYKSRVHKFFRKFLREPIKYIEIRCLEVM